MKKVKHETLWSNLEKVIFYKIFAAKLVCNVCVLSTSGGYITERDERGEIETEDNLSLKFGAENPLTDREGSPGSS